MGGGNIYFNTIVEGKGFGNAICVETFFGGCCQEVLMSRGECMEGVDRGAQGGDETSR